MKFCVASKLQTLSPLPWPTHICKLVLSLITTVPLSNSSALCNIPANPSNVPVSWHKVSASYCWQISWSRLIMLGSSFWIICLFGKKRAASRPAMTVNLAGCESGCIAMKGLSARYPLICCFNSSGPRAIHCRTCAPPILWPIRNTGIASTLFLSWASIKEVISANTVVVGPVNPREAGEVTERPHPRWSTPNVWIPRKAKVGNNSWYALMWSEKPWMKIRMALGGSVEGYSLLLAMEYSMKGGADLPRFRV